MAGPANEPPAAEVWIVEGVRDGVATLVLDSDDEHPVVSQVAAALLEEVGEGLVLQVPLGSVGEPQWEKARVVGRL